MAKTSNNSHLGFNAEDLLYLTDFDLPSSPDPKIGKILDQLSASDRKRVLAFVNESNA